MRYNHFALQTFNRLESESPPQTCRLTWFFFSLILSGIILHGALHTAIIHESPGNDTLLSYVYLVFILQARRFRAVLRADEYFPLLTHVCYYDFGLIEG